MINELKKPTSRAKAALGVSTHIKMIESSIRKVSVTSGRLNKFGINLTLAGLGILFLTTGISAIHKYLTGQITSFDPMLQEYPILLWGPICIMIVGVILMFAIRRKSVTGFLQLDSESLIFIYNQQIKNIDLKDVHKLEFIYHDMIDDTKKASLEVQTENDKEYVYLTDRRKWKEIELTLTELQNEGIEIKIER
ncbi:hypothetical protein [Tunicatimonas pelagia]|uniref:hypothetical protein n=1 Tax=Tunicatimonas pelagia TaxID=931531 RepID=UPI002665027B|nr:hypothetical protein [Tunicatimonas pelagia]WKN43574.1 hypothetical protein P0M28_01145 [Tunicatimonas pelagia]